MSELDDRLRSALKDEFPWAQDLPLTKKFEAMIRANANVSTEEKLRIFIDMTKEAIKSVGPYVETTELTFLPMVAALRILANALEKNLSPAEKQIAEILPQLYSIGDIVFRFDTGIPMPPNVPGEKE